MIKKYLKLLTSFIKIGAFTFDSGYAMITLIKKEVVDKQHWLNDEEVAEIIAISESTPGSISVSSSTFIGYKVAGFLGSIIATAGIILPSAIVISIVSYFLKQFENNVYVDYAFFGIRCAVLVLIINASGLMYKESPKDQFSLIMMAATFVLVAFLNVTVLSVIVASVAISVIRYYVKERLFL